MTNHRYNNTVSEVLDALENAYMDVMHQARLIAMESDLKERVKKAMQEDAPFTITNELLHECTDENVKRCLRSAENIWTCTELLGKYYRQSPGANVAEN